MSYVAIEIQKNMLVSQKDVEHRYSVDHLFGDIRASLGDSEICANTLKTYLTDQIYMA